MNRRQLLIQSAQLGLAAAGRQTLGKPPGPRALPTPDQIAWQDLEVGMFVHFAPNTWQDTESDNLSTPLSAIDPAKLDTDQWARTALSFGARYIVFVAKHQGGFCMWQTHTTEYSIRNTPWRNGKGDVLADVSASCRKFGLKLGVYICPRDDNFGAKTGGICSTPELQARYNAMYREQLTEVLSRYGEMVEVWFDGSTAAPVADILRKYQPHAMVFQGPAATIRWVGNEDGLAPNPCWNGIDRADARTGTATSLNSDPNGDTWMPNEVDVSIRRPDWFWSTVNEKKVLTPDQLLSIYYGSVGRGCQLLLNIPANRDGLLAEPDCTSARAFGLELQRRFAKPVAQTSGTGAAITLTLPAPTKIDTVILQEDTAKGERIREYRIEGHSGGNWQPLGTGTSVGHKRIQPVSPSTIDALRLITTQHVGTPILRTLAVFDTGVAPPTGWNATPQIWAADLVGNWASENVTSGRFSLDLTKKIDAAAQYRLRFVPASGKITALRNVVLKLHGVSEPGLIKPVRGKPDELILDITGVAETVQISGEVLGAPAGQILLQKL
jgi:alpha-L-fucosidase